MTVTSKKLIEVALPLEAINAAAAREKSIRHGHPSTLHLWWARRPLAAARAVIFAQMVDDPSGYIDELRGDDKLRRKAERELAKRLGAREIALRDFEQASRAGLTIAAPGPKPTLDDVLAEIERDRLFKIIEELVLWESTTNEKVLDKARAEIWQSWRRTCARNADHPRAAELFNRNKLPAFHDPFAGGGALPLEAQRLGLEAYASDLNPVAVLINKAMIEIPPKFANRPPVHPPEDGQAEMPREWKGTEGLAEDIRYYGQWMRDEAEKRIGHLYPKVEITVEMINERPDLKRYLGRKLTVIAWIWARTVKSPNPAFAHVDVPLASTFMLSTKAGKEAHVSPVIVGDSYRFTVKAGTPKDAEAAKRGTKAGGSHSPFVCLMSGVPMPFEYLRSEARAGRMSTRLMAIVAEGDRERVYLAPLESQVVIANACRPEWRPEVEISHWPGRTNVVEYGLTTFGDLFSARQLVALTSFSDIVDAAREAVRHDALATAQIDDGVSLTEGGTGARAYAEATAVYLAFALSRSVDRGSTICSWDSSPKMEALRNTFGRQAIPMVWDHAEGNPFSESSGNWTNNVDWVAKAVRLFPIVSMGQALQADAQTQSISQDKVVSTDPPYFDNIGYADLSDFFYVWLRRTLKSFFPDLLATMAVPKAEELVATPYRHGSKENAERFFLTGMTHALQVLSGISQPAYPISIYYAFKQSESESEGGSARTGWETFLGAIVAAGLSIEGTWPMRTELGNRMIGKDANALASSIIIVCQPRQSDAEIVTRRDFVAALKTELPASLRLLQAGNIAPVDLAQAAIGPGMSVFTRFSRVLDAEGNAISVREALTLINQVLDETLSEQEGDLDAETRWAVAWFSDHGFDDGPFGDAHTYFVRYMTAENALQEAGIVLSGRGKVRLLRPDELPETWTAARDARLTVWEIVHHLIRALEAEGERSAALLVRELRGQEDVARELCYRLFNISERQRRSTEAYRYNSLVKSWPEITRLAKAHTEEHEQDRLL